MYKLIIEDDEGKTWIVPLIRDEITIGRKEGNTVRLTEKNVSRKHARLSRANGTVFIEDLSSYNGIRVNGDRIAGRAPISEGDRIQIGDYQLALKLDKNAADEGATQQVPTARSMDDTPLATYDAATRANPIVAPIAPTIENERPARLVVVSSNFAGKEFRLDKPQVVIGRTEENDVVVNHRSISRHHAKIVREQGRYHVVDLGSANGVRVNGEEYGKVELRKGDQIDLGHVRLRFIAPGEDFVFARDAKVVDVGGSGDKKRPMKLIAALGALAVLLVGGVVLAVARHGGGNGPTPAAAGKASAAEYVTAVDQAIAAADWDTAISKAEEGLKIAPDEASLRDKRARAETEKKNQGIYNAYIKAVKANDLGAAVTRYGEIPETSSYHQKAQDSWPMVKRSYLKDELGQARDLQTASKCEEAKKHVEAVLLVDEGNAEAQEIARKCGKAAAAPAAARPVVAAVKPLRPPSPAKPPKGEAVAEAEPVKAAPPPPPPAPRKKDDEAAAPGASADALISDAQVDYTHGNYQQAIDKAKKAIKLSGGNNPKGWRIVGSSSCFLHDKAGAVLAWNKLGAMERQFLNYVCQRNNIKIP